MIPYIVAGAGAVLIAAVEQYRRLRARFTLQDYAWVWWLIRFVVEASAALIAVAILQATDVQASPVLLGLLAASGASAILRLRVLELGPDEGSQPLGIATLYDPLRDVLSHQINKRCAEQQSHWVNVILLPDLERNAPDPAELGRFVKDYLAALPNSTAREREYIDECLHEDQSDRIKRELIARHAVTLGAFRLLDKFRQVKSSGDAPDARG